MRLPGGLRAVAVVVVLACVLGACSDRSEERPEILVLAAASLADAMAEVENEFERNGDASVSFSYGGSQTLARQIVGGAPADVFISAGNSPMDDLRAEGLVEGDPAELFGNVLVVATRSPQVSPTSLVELLRRDGVRVAVADPQLAPAGLYARQSLSSLGLWEPAGGSLVFAPDVRSALAYAQSGNVDAAIVYRTDADAVEGVRTLDIVPAESHEPIVYPAAVVGRTSSPALAEQFVEFLLGPEAQAIFRRKGFVVLTR